ncbi:MAG: hypothetical protein MAG551_00522 [Candidatus Scalindua arabica]|uniref:Uncharacterized protein n=1 Tax=Candidatus Scalindua arabica TaxID=1127984 RepID=A0A941W0Z3_9BACT|nr:hypothetical protein [Candidatus Scalindua arabica]
MVRLIKVLLRSAGILFFIVLIGYLLVAFLLPTPKEPEPISLNGSKFERVFEPFDGQFVAVYITKNISDEESLKYLQEWENLNAGFDRRDLTELVGFDKRRSSISNIRCLVLIDCRNGKYHRFKEEHYDEKGGLIHYISSEEKQDTWVQISKASIIDELAMRFCEKSAY